MEIENKDKETQEELKEKIYNVETIYHNFLENLNSVNWYFNKFGTLATGEDESIKEKSEEYFKTVIQDLSDKFGLPQKEEEESKITKKQAEDFFEQLQRSLSKRPKISPRNYEILSRSSFLMLNNYFEYLISDLLSYYYNKYKSSLNEKIFKLTLKELSEYDTIEEASKDLILKEVESLIIEKSFDQLLDHFQDNLSISLEKDLIKWKKIIEIRERRHLIVHNSSIVNKKYITRTGNPYNFEIGDTIHIEKDYFINSWREFKLAGLFLIFNCWGNWDKDNIDSAVYELMIQTFEDLKIREYNNVCKICSYSEKIIPKNEDQEDYLLRIKVNHAIALKKQKKEKELTKALKGIKIGTATPIFKVVHQILKDDHLNLEENFKRAILLNELNIDFYLEWPIFEFVREDESLNHRLLKTFEVKNLG